MFIGSGYTDFGNQMISINFILKTHYSIRTSMPPIQYLPYLFKLLMVQYLVCKSHCCHVYCICYVCYGGREIELTAAPCTDITHYRLMYTEIVTKMIIAIVRGIIYLIVK